MLKRHSHQPQPTEQTERQFTAPSGYAEDQTSIGIPLKVSDVNAERGFRGETPIHDRNFTPQERIVRDRRMGKSSTPLWLESVVQLNPTQDLKRQK